MSKLIGISTDGQAAPDEAGIVPFAHFMDLALYGEKGYYRTLVSQRDYRTSAHVSPAFGHCLASLLADLAGAVRDRTRFDIVELGAGDLALAHQIVAWLRHHHPAILGRRQYLAADLFLRANAAFDEIAAVVADVRVLPFRGVVGAILSNELFDALPFHRVGRDGSHLYELHVDTRGSAARYVRRPLPVVLARYLETLGVTLLDGQIADMCPDAEDAYRAMCQALQRGFLITIDYGGGTPDLYGPWRLEGTALAYRSHTVHADLLADPGRQDITAHVDFDRLEAVGSEAGLITLYRGRQGEFLRGRVDRWLGRLEPSRLTPADLFNARHGASELTAPGGLGRMCVLVQTRGVEAPPDLLV